MIVIQEKEFREVFVKALSELTEEYAFVTGPGRSGAIASVYASHYLGVPFIPYTKNPILGPKWLIVDTAIKSGRTIRKASRNYGNADICYAYDQSTYLGGGRVKFWYEELSMTRGKGNEYRIA